MREKKEIQEKIKRKNTNDNKMIERQRVWRKSREEKTNLRASVNENGKEKNSN